MACLQVVETRKIMQDPIGREPSTSVYKQSKVTGQVPNSPLAAGFIDLDRLVLLRLNKFSLQFDPRSLPPKKRFTPPPGPPARAATPPRSVRSHRADRKTTITPKRRSESTGALLQHRRVQRLEVLEGGAHRKAILGRFELASGVGSGSKVWGILERKRITTRIIQ